MSAFLPYACAVMMFLLLLQQCCIGIIYITGCMKVSWILQGAPNYDKIIAGKEAYLNPIFFIS